MTPNNPPSLRLAFCLFRYFPHGGLQRDMLQIARACCRRGHRVSVLTQSWDGPRPEGLDVTCINVRAGTNHARARRFARRAGEHLSRTQPEGIVGFNKMPGLDLYYAADGCYAARPDLSAAARWLPRTRQYRQLEASVFAPGASTVILALTPRQQADYQICYGTPAERFVQLPPNLSPERRRPAQAATLRNEIRAQLGITPDRQWLLQVGSAFHTKGLDRSLQALAALPEACRARSVLTVTGAGKTQPWQRMAKRLGVERQVRFLGPRDDVMSLMLGAEILLHPSRRESAGIVLLEALVAGLPTLVSGACGYSFHVAQAGSGWVLPEPFCQADFNQTLQTALTGGPLEQQQQQALAYAERSDLSGMVDAAVAAIEQTLGSGDPSPN